MTRSRADQGKAERSLMRVARRSEGAWGAPAMAVGEVGRMMTDLTVKRWVWYKWRP